MIHDETPADAGAIHALNTLAFPGAAHARGTGAAITDALALSLIATKGGRITGHAAFPPLQVEGAESGSPLARKPSTPPGRAVASAAR
jgi:predicted N-acetyltransferase YhbS